MIISPSSKIVICDTKLTIEDAHQLTFPNLDEQQQYFSSLKSLVFEEYSYQRENSTIRLELPYDKAIQYNYCFYQNEAYTDKIFYAFITSYEYINDAVTAVTIQTDVWQTWQFDLTFSPSFIEREHVNDDTPGKHLIPENLETGSFIPNGVTQLTFADREKLLYCMQISDFPATAGYPNIRDIQKWYDGVPSGAVYLCFDVNNADDMYLYNKFLNLYTTERPEALIAIFPIPYEYYSAHPGQFAGTETGFIGLDGRSLKYIQASNQAPTHIENIIITPPTSLDGYAPRNKKLLTYPYNYFFVTNNQGSNAEYRFEDFNGNPNFVVSCALTTGMDCKIYPLNLKNATSAFAGYCYGIKAGSFPLGSWNNDTYSNWWVINRPTQDATLENLAVSNSLSAVSAGVSALMGGNPISLFGTATEAIASSFATINNLMAQKESHAMLPNQLAGTSGQPTLDFSTQSGDGVIMNMSIKEEFAKKLDLFFGMYGYRVNDVKLPNITGRANWNYVKAPDIIVTGDVPQLALEEIKRLFHTGITFWHRPSTFLDYNAPNEII